MSGDSLRGFNIIFPFQYFSCSGIAPKTRAGPVFVEQISLILPKSGLSCISAREKGCRGRNQEPSTQIVRCLIVEMEEVEVVKPKKNAVGGRLCCLCNQRRPALKRPKTLEQVPHFVFLFVSSISTIFFYVIILSCDFM